jgi:hypothetical protein
VFRVRPLHGLALLAFALSAAASPAFSQTPPVQPPAAQGAPAPQPPPAAQVVALKLTNHTLLIGHIVSETADAIVFDVTSAGQLTIKRSDIATQLDAAALAALTAPPPPPPPMPPPPVGIGVFTTKDQTLWVRTADFNGAFTSAAFKQGELDPNYPGLTGAVLKLAGDQTTVQARVSIMRSRPLHSAYFDSSFTYANYEPFGKQADMPTVSVGYSFRQRENQRFYELVRYSWYRDPVRAIKYSHQLFFGMGIKAADGKVFKWNVVPAIGVMREHKGIPAFDDQNLVGWGGFSQILITPNPIVQIENRELFSQAFTNTDFSSVQSDLSLKTSITKHVAIQVAVTFKYDNAIAQAVTTIPPPVLGPSPVNVYANNSSQVLSTLGLHITF